MNKNSNRPWKSGWGALLVLFGFSSFLVAVSFLAFSLHDPSDQTAIIFLGLGLLLFGVCAIFGVANWVVEKQVNHNLVWLGYTKPFEMDSISLGWDENDPLISFRFDGNYVSRRYSQVFSVDLTPVALGVSLYLFYCKDDTKKNFCVVYNKYGLLGLQFKAYKHVS